ncbi:MAG: class II aldolase/adducin family protein [Deltaproteobacteria bacterium]|jgi:L-ribulose-5-phosphate 4-epimerase|nr:class II aldolase/adducin family protein [Deltaproteobacteria bacterium]
MDEGYVKFQSQLNENYPPSDWDLNEAFLWRDKLYRLKYIGAYENGIGYGNISIRSRFTKEFIISGTATGNVATLLSDHFTRVSSYNLKKNQVVCSGKVHASSESMTHAAVYDCDPTIKAVIHIHSKKFWQILKYQLPTSDPSAKYGTPEMAKEIIRLYNHSAFKKIGVMVMGGHEEGILSFGSTLDEAGKRLLDKMPLSR